MPIWLHVAAAAACAALLGIWFFFGRPSAIGIRLVSGSLVLAMATGLWLMMRAGGLPYSLFFGHVMHWLGWLAVLTWLHALTRSAGAAARGGVSLVLVMAACAAGILALVQPRL